MSAGCRLRHGRSRSDARGSAAVIAVALIGALLTATLFVTTVGSVLADQRRVESAVDLGALAGATAAQDGRPVCQAAASVLRRNAAELTGCGIDGAVVTVHAARRTHRILGLRLTVSSTARAGPADGGAGLR